MVHSIILRKIAKVAIKPIGKMIGKKVGKKIIKKLPGIGAVFSAGWFVADILMCDYVGAAFDAADFVGAFVPPVSAATTLLEVSNEARDLAKASASITYQIANAGAQIGYTTASAIKDASDVAHNLKSGVDAIQGGFNIAETLKDAGMIVKDLM